MLLTVFALAGTGCSTGGWNHGLPASPLLGIDENGIWRFPTPHPPSSAELSPQLSPLPSATPSSSASEPAPERPIKPRTRQPKPYAQQSGTPRAT